MSGKDNIELAPQQDEKAIISHEADLEESKPRFNANNQLDDAAKLLAEVGGHVEYDTKESKRVLRMIDLHVCVPMMIMYFVQQCDKSSLSWTAVFDIQTETGLVGSQYSWLSSVVYCAQLVCQPLSAYALIVFPVKWWILFNFTAWSIVTCATAAAKNFTGLLIARLFLGIFEATILPSFILLTQMWWIRREQSYRSIAYQIANSCAGLFGPLLSYGIGKACVAHNQIHPYQGIFLFMGCLSLGFVPIVVYLLPNSPTTARFLKKGNDRLIAVDRLRDNNTGTKAAKFKWSQVLETYRDPKTWMWMGMWFCAACPSGGIGAFSGLITKGFGFDQFTTILMQMPTGAIGIILLLLSIYVTNKIKMRWPVLAVITCFPIAGAIALTQVDRNDPGALLGTFYITQFFSGIQPLLISWCNLNAAGTTKRVVNSASMFAALTVGNIIGPQVYLKRCWIVELLLVLAMGQYLRYLNKKQNARRVALGFPDNIKDMSIMSTAEADAYKIELTQMMVDAGIDMSRFNEGSFDDMTDFENPFFMYAV